MQKQPIRIDYKRWKHTAKGHVVVVTDVLHKSGTHGELTFVTFQQVKTESRLTWPAEVFLRSYKPIGRKFRPKSLWEWLKAKDEF